MPGENAGHLTTRAEAFPYGLRVLVVDDDPTWLKILEKMLKKCSYEGGGFLFHLNVFLHFVFAFLSSFDVSLCFLDAGVVGLVFSSTRCLL